MPGMQEQTIVPNEVYDIIKAIGEKLEGLAAYKKYEQDGNGELWRKMRETDEQAVRSLMGELDKCAKDGKLAVH